MVGERNVYGEEKLDLDKRFYFAVASVALLFFLLVFTLWRLQVLQGSYYRTQSENNRQRRSFVPAPRGRIFDRDGIELVSSRPSFNIEFVQEDSPDPKETLEKLSQVLEVPVEELRERIRKDNRRARFEPKVLLRDAPQETVARVHARLYELPGVTVNVYPARSYEYEGLASHVIGYIGEISAAELEDARYPDYRRGDLIGKYGLERQWERFLRGEDGQKQVIVNARGQRVASRRIRGERAGKDLTLTLSFRAQRAAEVALGDRRGAVVALVPDTGEVLALASAPGFDPNAFVRGISREELSRLFNGDDSPMSNRAVQGAYPPGSVFKSIMIAAGFGEQLVGAREAVSCNGFIPFGGRRFHCHKRVGHGAMNYHDALVRSCDIYFYVLGQRLGVDRMHDYATRFGLGSSTGLSLVQENPGLVPSTAWKARRYAGTEQEKWYPGENLSVAIGQGAMLATPIQLAVATAAFVNGGRVLRPQLLKRISSADASYKDDDFGPEVMGTVELSESVLSRIAKAMRDVVHGEKGTARRARLPEAWGIEVGGKTGTSQVVALHHETENERLKDHALFVAFAPVEDPEIVLAVIVENGESGGKAAAPVAKEVLASYFAPRMLVQSQS